MRAPDFWTGTDFGSKAARFLLWPLSCLYGASVAWKAKHAVPLIANAKIICVGNLTAGGSGKTPVAIAIAQALAARGMKPVFLSRGYGGRRHGPLRVQSSDSAADVGDEPLLLNAVAPVIVSRDRRGGALLAIENGADVIVMDDGFQNFDIMKDISIVVVDGEAGFGNGHVLPAGPLREPVSHGLKRADAVIVVGAGGVALEGFGGPVLHADIRHVDDGAFKDRRVVAFAGIGRPEKFFASLRMAGADLADTMEFGDHHAYTSADLARLRSKARSLEAELVTTEKDYVRLSAQHREGILVLPVRAIFGDQGDLDRLLDRVCAPA
jgi:tetraacyldisaccharide 4'-kinase